MPAPVEHSHSGQADRLGLDPQRLERLGNWLAAEVAAGEIPGAVLLVSRAGQIAYQAEIGLRDPRSGEPMRIDTIFRIASMTKPVTSLAAMMLAEEGALSLSDPVAAYLPRFAEMRVGVEGAPLHRPIIIHDLLRHTSGLSMLPPQPGVGGPVPALYAANAVFRRDQTLTEFSDRLASLPLMHQPGSTWEYSYSTDILGRIVELVAGQPLDTALRLRIFEPLGMCDTGFWVPKQHALRVAAPGIDAATGALRPMPDSTVRPLWLSGGSGLVSTARDYAIFCQMLLGKGRIGPSRLVSPSTMQLMTADHLSPNMTHSAASRARFGDVLPAAEFGYGFGLGFAIRTHAGRSAFPGSIREFGWAGAYGTCFLVDPALDLHAVLMLHGPMGRMRYRNCMRQLLYQALA